MKCFSSKIQIYDHWFDQTTKLWLSSYKCLDLSLLNILFSRISYLQLQVQFELPLSVQIVELQNKGSLREISGQNQNLRLLVLERSHEYLSCVF